MDTDELVENMKKIIEYTIFDYSTKPTPSLNPEIWRTNIRSINGRKPTVSSILLKRDAESFYYNFLDIVRDYCKEKNMYFSEKFLDDLMLDLIHKFRNVNPQQDTVKLIRKFLSIFDKTVYEKYTILLPINHYILTDEINLDEFKVKKLTREDFSEYCTSSKVDTADKDFKNLTVNNNTDTIAIIKVESIKEDDAVQKAKNILKKFIHGEKLFNPNSFITTRLGYYTTIKDTLIVCNEANEFLSDFIEIHHQLDNIVPTKNFYEEIKPYRAKLHKFLFNTRLSSFQESIIASMCWFGDVDIQRDTNTKKYISYIVGLEKLSMKKYENRKKNKFGLCIATFQKIKEKQFYEKYYEKRNNLLHDENLRIFDEQVSTLQDILRRLLLEMIDHYDEFQTIDEFWSKQYNIEL